jgi:hypothetical protein
MDNVQKHNICIILLCLSEWCMGRWFFFLLNYFEQVENRLLLKSCLFNIHVDYEALTILFYILIVFNFLYDTILE